jgi:hypothetical protein
MSSFKQQNSITGHPDFTFFWKTIILECVPHNSQTIHTDNYLKKERGLRYEKPKHENT